MTNKQDVITDLMHWITKRDSVHPIVFLWSNTQDPNVVETMAYALYRFDTEA